MRQINNALLVEGDPISNMVNEEMLQQSKFAIKIGSYLDADEALAYLKHLTAHDLAKFPTVIFLDINMPEMDGWKFLNDFNKFPEFILKNCKVCVLASNINQWDIERLKEYKMVYNFIAKPLTFDKIETAFSA